jgi:hypothetical protein
MGTYKAKCDICYTENEVPTYGDWDCSECRQPYEYDEGHRIHLTDAQLEWLRQRRITDEERQAIQRAIDSQQQRAAEMHSRSALSRSRAAEAIEDDCDTLRWLLERLG